MNLDHDFFQVSKLSEDQKMEHFFPQIQVGTGAQMHFGYIPHPLWVSAPLSVSYPQVLFLCTIRNVAT